MALVVFGVIFVILQTSSIFKVQGSVKTQRQSNVFWRAPINKSEDMKTFPSNYNGANSKVSSGIHYKRNHFKSTLIKENKKRKTEEAVPPNEVLLETVGKNIKGKALDIGFSDIIKKKRVVQKHRKTHPKHEDKEKDEKLKRIIEIQKHTMKTLPSKENNVIRKGIKKFHVPAVYGKLYRQTEKPESETKKSSDFIVRGSHILPDKKNFADLNKAFLTHVSKQDEFESAGLHAADDTSIAAALTKKVRVLCWVLTHPHNHNITLTPIKETWGRRCSTLLFISTQEDKSIPTVRLNVKEGRSFLWPKVKAAFLYVYTYYRNEADWFLRADDDTYMVMENLRYMLSSYNPKEPLYFGCRFKPFTSQGYMSGGAGVVLSREALFQLVKSFKGPCKASDDDENDDVELGEPRVDQPGFMRGGAGIVLSGDALDRLAESFNDTKKKLCNEAENNYDDVQLGICLNRIGVKAMDTRDALQKGRFMPFMPQDHIKMAKDVDNWYLKYTYYPVKSGLACCSDYAISFHYVSPDDMYALEYLIYHVRPFGIQFTAAETPQILTRDSQISAPKSDNQDKSDTGRVIRLDVDEKRLKNQRGGTDLVLARAYKDYKRLKEEKPFDFSNEDSSSSSSQEESDEDSSTKSPFSANFLKNRKVNFIPTNAISSRRETINKDVVTPRRRFD